MPYIKRDNNQEIISLHEKADSDDQEFIEANDPELLKFVSPDDASDKNKLFLSQSDFELVRVLEDLIDLLTEKHNILFTDLPSAAQEKLLKRKNVRKDIQHSIIDDADNDIF